tara:strand:+ start:2390 stop:3154 length:765 start_codon:yes stop_codon:yes gene_type:complete
MNFKEKLKNCEQVLGTWITSPSVSSLDSICSSELDFVILDQEHGSITSKELLPLINTAKARGVNTLVRPSHISKESIQHALDQGANGIQVPNIENKSEALKVVEFSKYPPIGTRGYSPFIPSSNYINNGISWNENMNNNIITGINVEGQEAIQNIEDILDIRELDVIFVGLFDLSKAMGIPGEVNHQKVIDKLKRVVKLCKEKHISIGTIATSLEHMNFLIKLGVNFIVYMVDMNVLSQSYKLINESFKNYIKK